MPPCGSASRRLWPWIVDRVAVSIWISALFGTVLSIVVAALCLPHPLATLWLSIQAVLLFVPIPEASPQWAQRLIKWSVDHAIKYFPLKLVLEDEAALKIGRPYVLGYEPHSALPIGMPIVFSDHSALLPPAFAGVRVLATSAVFWCPVVRHLFFWLGARPASAATMHSLLGAGQSTLVCPGGVQECLHMAHGREVAFLCSRTAFVRIAMQHGAPLVPVFCFGQTDTYHWVRLGPPLVPEWLVEVVARKLRFLPLLMLGSWGSLVPCKVPMLTVIGAPIEVPKTLEPTSEELQKYLQAFIDAMERIFAKHKDAAGYSNLELSIL